MHWPRDVWPNGKGAPEETTRMSQYRVSNAARADLDEIWLYIAQDNEEAALIGKKENNGRRSLASMPQLGRVREESCHLDCASFSDWPLCHFIGSDWERMLKSSACCMGRGISTAVRNKMRRLHDEAGTQLPD